MYEKRFDLIDRRNKSGLTNRELARALGEPPSTTGGRLCGFLPLTESQEKIILQTFKEAEQRREEEDIF